MLVCRGPSWARTVTEYIPSPRGSMVPVTWPAPSMLRPGGRFDAVKLPGSASTALLVRFTTAPSLLVCGPGLFRIGGRLSLTVQLKLTLLGLPRTVALTVTV